MYAGAEQSFRDMLGAIFLTPERRSGFLNNGNDHYREFLRSKMVRAKTSGIEVLPEKINPLLYDFQRDICVWALRKGKSAIFADCGLGKTGIYLEWANQIVGAFNQKVLILTPLAVAAQTVREGNKFGVEVKYCRSQSEVKDRKIIVTNYEMLKEFDAEEFLGVVLDESSILKSFTGKTKRFILEVFKDTKFKLACTATPAPNDHLELGNHAEFLSVMRSNEMISRWFINNSMAAGDYRLKGYAEEDFWRWVTTWAVCISKPSDLGDEYRDDLFILPPLNIISHKVKVDHKRAYKRGEMFLNSKHSATTMWEEKRETAQDRAADAARIINSNGQKDDPVVIWCDTDYEADLLKSVSPNAVEVRGSDSRQYKEDAVRWFLGELYKCQLITKKNSAKLAIWETADKGTIKNSTENTESGDLQLPVNTRENMRKQNKNIGQPIILLTKNDSRNICESTESEQRKSVTQGDDRDMQQILYSEKPQNLKQESGHKVTLLKLSPKILSNSELPQSTMPNCLINRGEDVQYVVGELQIEESTDCMSIMTTKQEKSGDYSVGIAISDLENSGMIPISSNVQCCTCEQCSHRKILISKAEIFGWGLNLQHCSNQIFVGVTFSFEKLYQALRRSWRFGQKNPVNAHIIYAESEGNIIESIRVKQQAHSEMQGKMNKAMRKYGITHEKGLSLVEVNENKLSGNGWTLYEGDCVTSIKNIPDQSVHFTIFSPPFKNLYIYSDSVADMGNSLSDEEFFTHFGYVIPEIKRITLPGRLCAVHCKDLPLYMNRDGAAGLYDMPGKIISAFEKYGWIFHSRITIWKDPVTEMQRTKNHGLLHKNFVARAEVCRTGMADYVIVFRKWDGEIPDMQVHHEVIPGEYIGENPPEYWEDQRDHSIQVWQRYASPVWFDINQMNVLNTIMAREEKDEKHLCPLQLDVIERCIWLWTNPGEMVFDPFAGIGSTGYVALGCDREFTGIELKPAYVRQAVKNLKAAEKKQLTMFDGVDNAANDNAEV